MNEKTIITDDGLRYSTKKSGSPFGTALGYMHSCIRCGKHQPSGVMTVLRVAGTNFYRCLEPCGAKAKP